ncbi:MAG: UDP-N-acetylglucosamine--N-acetylmuramyl-(pentapeptide) pyrophosphoryl-undecaprenol N-acetylglucosamine transferase [bacterium]
MKILFTGGGTAGHILPIIAVAREMRRIYPQNALRFFYLGPRDDFALILLSQEGIQVKTVLSGKIRRYFNWQSVLQNLLDIFLKIPLGILQSFFYVFLFAPDLIFSKGGYGSIPGVIAGKLLWVPIFSHESDISPGISNRILAKFALKIFVSFEQTEGLPLKKMILTGNPIRRELFDYPLDAAKKLLKIQSAKPVILIIGGSQGAQRINDRILEILPELLKDFEIAHQAGEKNFAQVKAEAKVVIAKEAESFYHLFPFLKEEELKQVYAASDIIVSRAGSSSIFEIAAIGKPSILIPLPESAQNHQVKNAYAYAQTGTSQVLEESNFTPHFFLEKLRYLAFHPEELEKMSKAAKDFSKPEAAKTIANYIFNYYGKNKN